ncbi:helix-turn-helix domain-containing protein [Subdoligranulum variabile]|uniref:DNA-binding helix-turn-helix protein n=1 Tax=Subdoligranulum variabile DSM 15176 TaxID=411471 RepID=D1PI87_9FIRM|nr:helix-turn-helix transcriptional regulator [Subdoligranulum variabile]EFB77601.1 DNA-binding helix-turn-helix protein [Subdoligranulum variabile DSM 15176]UWP67162.1 helix-turn-helix domain-containing protein [Subdoligranulum variabile]
MFIATLWGIFNLAALVGITAVLGYLVYLLIRALRKYLATAPVRQEKARQARTLGEVLRQHRTDCRMTQEFVAESLGVSRQAVSKWESGKSDPSTTNLMALARLYGLPPEELLREAE